MDELKLKKLGGDYGILFGWIGLITAYLLLSLFYGSFIAISDQFELVLLILIVLVFSVLSRHYGIKATQQIILDKSKGTLTGAYSSIRVLFITSFFVGLMVIVFEMNERSDLDIGAVFACLTLLPLAITALGALPAVLIGMMFGSFIESKRK